MTYSVHQHWDPLRACIVGRSWNPEFYGWIKTPHVRHLFERIAEETEEDYQNLITKLESFGVNVLRPNLPETFIDGQYTPPPMSPRDLMIMVGDKFYRTGYDHGCYQDILKHIQDQGNEIIDGPAFCNGAMTTRVGKDLYVGTFYDTDDTADLAIQVRKEFPDYRTHIINTNGHTDGTFCPVVPGLIVSLFDAPTYSETFPDWEIVYLPGQSWGAVKPFLDLKQKNQGKWWIPGFEHDQDVVNVVETWLSHWTGYVEETVFDVNMLVVDQKNVIVFNHNDLVFDAFARHGITPHVVPFRHRYFWDGGIHCITTDLHRDGAQQNFFPNRDNHV